MERRMAMEEEYIQYLIEAITQELKKPHRAVILEIVLALLKNPKSKSAAK